MERGQDKNTWNTLWWNTTMVEVDHPLNGKSIQTKIFSRWTNLSIKLYLNSIALGQIWNFPTDWTPSRHVIKEALSSCQKDLSSRGCWHIILQVFNGSRDTITPVYQSFSPPISASQIRVVPFSKHPRVVCLRLELHGCKESSKYTVFENHRKSLIQHCERSELPLHFEWTKMVQFGEFLKT